MPRLSPTAHTADRNLVKGLNDGDETAYAALYDQYGERLYDYALSMTGETKVAADIVHDTFIDACRRAPRLRDHLLLGSWLYGAARRRCIRRGRVKVLYWDRDGEFSDVPFLERGEPDEPAPDWPPSDELHDLFHGALAELEPVQQEVMLLAFRHGLRPGRLGAVLGLSARRAAMRVRKGRAEFAAALQREIDRANRACAVRAGDAAAGGSVPSDVLGGTRPSDGRLGRILHRRPEVAVADPSTERHTAACPDCRRRGRVTAAALFRRAPAPVLPAALRHRFMHTATDPELAGYRADIAARGGALTPSGLPSQPDVPSPYTRRWLSTVGLMTAALGVVLGALMAIGPGIGGPLPWPPAQTEPQPSITRVPPPNGSSTGAEPPGAPGAGAGAPGMPAQPPPVRPQSEEDTAVSADSPRQPHPSAPPVAGPGALVVDPGEVELHGTKTAQVTLTAEGGPVKWTAETSTRQLELSETEGEIKPDGTTQVTVTLRTFLIGLPGEGTITFTDSEGVKQTVKVVWGVSLL
ncbi:MAG TPA: sigma-70 family RNA polymerase sigma factor [Spirillospora sp.]